MNIAGGAAAVQAQALEYDINSADVAQAARDTAGHFPALASEVTAADLDIVSSVTGRGDGLAMNIAGGAAEVQAQALEYGITPDEVAQAARGTTGSVGRRASAGCNMATAQAASALATGGVSNPNMAFNARNPDGLRLGAEIGLVVMGPVQWEQYITTSAKQMTQSDKPFTTKEKQKLAAKQPKDEREGWVFHRVVQSTSQWAMADEISPCPATPQKIPCYMWNHCEQLFPKHTTTTGIATRSQRTRTRRTKMLARR